MFYVLIKSLKGIPSIHTARKEKIASSKITVLRCLKILSRGERKELFTPEVSE